MGELTPDLRLAALEGWSRNPMVSPAERLAAAHQVIDGLRAREHERVRLAVADAMRYARVNWIPEGSRTGTFIQDMISAEQMVRAWEPEPGWCCPFCEEVTCDDDCPLARVRGELG